MYRFEREQQPGALSVANAAEVGTGRVSPLTQVASIDDRISPYVGGDEDAGNVEEQSMCSICLEPLSDGLTAAVQIQCAHWFHSNCLNEWLGRSGSCPLCRQEVREPTNHAATVANIERERWGEQEEAELDLLAALHAYEELPELWRFQWLRRRADRGIPLSLTEVMEAEEYARRRGFSVVNVQEVDLTDWANRQTRALEFQRKRMVLCVVGVLLARGTLAFCENRLILGTTSFMSVSSKARAILNRKTTQLTEALLACTRRCALPNERVNRAGTILGLASHRLP